MVNQGKNICCTLNKGLICLIDKKFLPKKKKNPAKMQEWGRNRHL